MGGEVLEGTALALKRRSMIKPKRTLKAAAVLSALLLTASASAESKDFPALESMYFATLDSWVEGGGRIEELRERVVKTCGKLVLVIASPKERILFLTVERDKYDFRVDVCTKMTVNRVHKQPEFKKGGIGSMLCEKSNVLLFKKLCKSSGLR